MSLPSGGFLPYGPEPWHQTSWDWRAAGNFIGGGAGTGLIVFAALANAQGPALAALMLAGLALVGAGLFCVALELGRPLRALNVFRNPWTSWMGREAWTSMLLFPAGLAAAWGVPGFAWAAAALALVFVYCQARLLQAAKGIPAWREPLFVPLLVTTGLAEGGGLFFASAPWHGTGTLWLLTGFGALVLFRILVWLAYRRRLAGKAAARSGGGTRSRGARAAIRGDARAAGADRDHRARRRRRRGDALGRRARGPCRGAGRRLREAHARHRRRVQPGLRARAPAGPRRAGEVTPNA